MNQQRRHVDELRCDIHIELLHSLYISQILCREFRDGNVVDVDVLLADQIEQEIERAFVDLSYSDSERELAWLALDWLRLRHFTSSLPDRWAPRTLSTSSSPPELPPS